MKRVVAILVLGLLSGARVASASPIVFFNFNATVTQTGGLAGVNVGDAITGGFSVDLGVPDTYADPLDTSRGNYIDAGLSLHALTSGSVPLNAVLPGTILVSNDIFSGGFFLDTLSIGFGITGGGNARLSMFTLSGSTPVNPLTSDAIPTTIDVAGFQGVFLAPEFLYQTDSDHTLHAILGTVTLDERIPGDPNAPVPEPVSLVLLGTGLIGARFARMRRKG